MNEQKRWLINNSETAEGNRLVALGGDFSINSNNYSKKQIRTNFDLRNLFGFACFGDPYGNRSGAHAPITPSSDCVAPSFSIPSREKKKDTQRCLFSFGDPYGNRTHVTAVKGPCLNRLTNGPYLALPNVCGQGW